MVEEKWINRERASPPGTRHSAYCRRLLQCLNLTSNHLNKQIHILPDATCLPFMRPDCLFMAMERLCFDLNAEGRHVFLDSENRHALLED